METKQQHKKRTQRGFTLVEMITVLAIITLMTTAFVLNYRLANQSRNLHTAADEMASALRQAQNLASTARAFPDNNGTVNVPKAYGVVIDKSTNTYFLFADRDGNGYYSNGTDDQKVGNDLSLTPGIQIADFANSANPSNIEVDTNHIYVTFVPPIPQTLIFRDRPSGTPGSPRAVTQPPILILLRIGTQDPSWKVVIDNVSGRISSDSYTPPAP